VKQEEKAGKGTSTFSLHHGSNVTTFCSRQDGSTK